MVGISSCKNLACLLNCLPFKAVVLILFVRPITMSPLVAELILFHPV